MPSFFFQDFIYFSFRQKVREGKREGEKHQHVLASHAPPSGDLGCNPGRFPDWEWNWPPFGSQFSPQSTEPHKPGLIQSFKIKQKNKTNKTK